MLEKIKRYISEKWEVMLMLISGLVLFYCVGTINDFNRYWNILIMVITFPFLAIFYNISLLFILNLKNHLKEEKTVIAIIISIVIELIQIFILLRFFGKSTSPFIKTLMLIIPYIVMVLLDIFLSNLERKKQELQAVLLTLLITVIIYILLIDIENIVLIVTLYNLIFLIVRKKIECLKGIKLAIVYLVLIGILIPILSLMKKEIRIYKINYIDQCEISSKDIDLNLKGKPTGICYVNIWGLKVKCGEVVNGVKEGKWIYWYRNCKKESEGMYKNGEKVGKWIEWNPYGDKINEGEYKDGLEEGKWIYWNDKFWNSDDEYGKESEGVYKDGKKEGKWVYWYGKGEKRMEATYRDGMIKGGFIQWYKNGNKKLEVDCDGEIDGDMLDYITVDKESKVKEWNEDGSLNSIKTFKNGKIIDIKMEAKNIIDKNIVYVEMIPYGEIEEYDGYWEDATNILIKKVKDGVGYRDINGKRYIFGKIKNGKKYGKWKIVDEKLSYVEGLYKDGKPEGNWEGWYDNGNKWKNINYKDGKLDGKYLIWYKSGKINCDGVYKNGEVEVMKSSSEYKD